jgi:transcriptional regulator with XRE-family HTH domain
MGILQVDVPGRVRHTGHVPEPDRRLLARHVRERRDELGLTQEEAAARGGPSTATLRLIENAADASYRPKSLRQLEQVLGWAPGSARAILAGGEPELLNHRPRDPRAPVGADLYDAIFEYLLSRGGTPHELVRFLAELGLPEHAELGILEWIKIARRCGLSLDDAVREFGVGVPAVPPPPPPVQVVTPGAGEALRRA